MAIGTAVERGNMVYVYDERGRQLLAKPAGHRETDGLTGFTSGSVSIRIGGMIYSYDEKGRQVSAVPIR